MLCIQNSQITEYSLLKQKKQIKQIKQKKKKLFNLLKISKAMYNTLFHFCMVILLQVLASLVIETLGLSKRQTLSQPLYILNKLSMIFTFFILIFIILNNFLNLFLDQSQTRQWNFKYGKHQKRYIQIFILYIFSTGILLFCFNTSKIKGVLFAYIPFGLSVVYGLFLIIYRPYKYTLFIHSISIIINQSIVILSFGFVSLKNIFPSISQYYFLIYSYANLSLCTICLIISIIRFIYQCKYGAQIMEKQKNDQEKEKYQKLHQKRQKQKKSLQSLIQSKKLKMIKMRKKNEYLMQNQILEEEQISFLNWLKQKTFLSKYQRDLLYFERYEDKPLKWLQIYQKQEYIKIKNKKQQQKKYSHPEDDEQLQNIKAQLRKQLKYKRFKVESSPQKSKPKYQINQQKKKTKFVKVQQNSKQKQKYEQKKNFRKTSFSQQKQIKTRKNNNDTNDLKRPFIDQKSPISKKRENSSQKKRSVEKQKKTKQPDTSKSKKRKQKKY